MTATTERYGRYWASLILLLAALIILTVLAAIGYTIWLMLA